MTRVQKKCPHASTLDGVMQNKRPQHMRKSLKEIEMSAPIHPNKGASCGGQRLLVVAADEQLYERWSSDLVDYGQFARMSWPRPSFLDDGRGIPRNYSQADLVPCDGDKHVAGCKAHIRQCAASSWFVPQVFPGHTDSMMRALPIALTSGHPCTTRRIDHPNVKAAVLVLPYYGLPFYANNVSHPSPWPFPYNKPESHLRFTYDAGYNQGFAAGHNAGYNAGLEAVREAGFRRHGDRASRRNATRQGPTAGPTRAVHEANFDIQATLGALAPLWKAAAARVPISRRFIVANGPCFADKLQLPAELDMRTNVPCLQSTWRSKNLLPTYGATYIQRGVQTDEQSWREGKNRSKTRGFLSRVVGWPVGIASPFSPPSLDCLASWQRLVRHAPRNVLVASNAGRAGGLPLAWCLRRALKMACEAADAQACSPHGLPRLQGGGLTSLSVVSDHLRHFMNSTFFLAPAGDENDRTAMSQALDAGCIPVFFEGTSQGSKTRSAFSRTLFGTENSDRWSVLIKGYKEARSGRPPRLGLGVLIGWSGGETAAAARTRE